jgi:BirA family transcriptional regulator, biotin operon repressor / biotin---[acetyl-CoA-carboxylase] ligase
MAVSEARLLARLLREPCSGDELAREFGLTRAGIWKRIQGLREAGVEVLAERGRGYRVARPLGLLDADAILAGLGARARAGVGSLRVVWETDSTNADLLADPGGSSGVSVLLAERQRAGRGRRGKDWASPLAANLYLSLSRRFDAPVARLGGLSLAVGVTLAQALGSLGTAGVRLKWPNDLWVDGRKLGGVLVEFGGELGGPVRAVIGIGVNVCMPDAAAAGIDQPWTDLAREGAATDRNRIAAALLDALLPALDAFESAGADGFIECFRGLDALAGEAVELQFGDQRLRGRALGLADDGGLRVALDGGGERVFHSGEVSLRRAG